jgi:hypothetical protein
VQNYGKRWVMKRVLRKACCGWEDLREFGRHLRLRILAHCDGNHLQAAVNRAYSASDPRAGANGYLSALNCSHGTAIAKIEAFNPASKSSYFLSVSEAMHLTQTNQARWHGPRQIILNPDISKRSHWTARGQSAIYSDGEGLGPKFCNLQLV